MINGNVTSTLKNDPSSLKIVVWKIYRAFISLMGKNASRRILKLAIGMGFFAKERLLSNAYSSTTSSNET